MEIVIAGLWQFVAPIIATALSGFLTWGAAEGAKFLREKANSAAADNAIDTVENLVGLAVQSAEQTTVKKLKQNGKLSREDAQQIKQGVINAVHNQLTPKVKKAAAKAVNDLDGFISDSIEKEVWHF